MRIVLNMDPRPWSTKRLEGVPDPRTDEGWAYWLEHGWKPGVGDDSRESAVYRYDPDGSWRANADFTEAHFTEACDGYWMCDVFDPEHGQCTAHDQRPPLCREYPWYGKEPSADQLGLMYSQCSYLADLPRDQRPEGARPLIPLTVISN
jgi:hypothetical protein